MNSSEVFGLSNEGLKRFIEEVSLIFFEAFSFREERVKIYFVSPLEIRRINREFRGIDKVSSVLSFPSQGFTYPPGEKMLGEIIFCYENIAREAKERNISEREWLGRLTIHSLLHLVGYSHEEEKEAQEMQRKEDAIFNSIKNLL